MAHFTLRSLTLDWRSAARRLQRLCPTQTDETPGWSAQKLYSEAKESMSDGAWDRAIKMFEKLEARYPYGRYAQQAQLEVAYAYYKSGEQASAVAACERFIKLHPNHPNVDYAYYLKGLAYFNEDLGLMGDSGQPGPVRARSQGPRATPSTPSRNWSSASRRASTHDDSTLRMRYLVNALAAYDVHVARYYHGAAPIVAAANRAQHRPEGLPSDARHRGSPVPDGQELRRHWSVQRAARRRRAGTAPELPRRAAYPAGDDYAERKTPWWKLW